MPRSFSASMTSAMFPCCRYRMPPCTSLVDRLEVPLPKSLISSRQHEYPRDAASTATPTPVAPPPMTAMSQGSVRARTRLREVSRFMLIQDGMNHRFHRLSETLQHNLDL